MGAGRSETDIANNALGKCGDYTILSLNDNTRAARLVNTHFADNRDKLLRSHPWKFATRRALLALTSTTPVWGFNYKYALPTDCVRVIQLSEDDYTWEVEDGCLLTDLTAAAIKYVYKCTESGKWDACFCDVLSLMIAEDICYALTQNAALKKSISDDLKLALAEARSFNGQEGGVRQVYANTWLNSRN